MLRKFCWSLYCSWFMAAAGIIVLVQLVTGHNKPDSDLDSGTFKFPNISTSRVLRVTSIIEYPYLTLKPDGLHLTDNDRFEGFCKELLDALSNELGFQYKLALVKDSRFGSMDPESMFWNGIVGELVSGEADFAISSMSITATRAKAIDFSFPFASFRQAVLIPTQEISISLQDTDTRVQMGVDPSPWSFLYPFTTGLWALLILTLLIIVGYYFLLEWIVMNPTKTIEATRRVFYLIIRRTRDNPDNPEPDERVAVAGPSSSLPAHSVASAPEEPPIPVTPIPLTFSQARTKAGTFIKTTLTVFLFIIISAYIAKYTSILNSNSKLHNISKHGTTTTQGTDNVPLPMSLEDIWVLGKHKIIVAQGGSSALFLKSSSNPINQQIYQQIVAAQGFVRSSFEGIQLINKSQVQVALAMEEFGAKYIAAGLCKKMQVLSETFGPKKSFAVAFPKGSVFLDIFNEAILRLKESGKMEDLENRKEMLLDQGCKVKRKSSKYRWGRKRHSRTGRRPMLSLSSMAGSIYLLMTSVLIAAVIATLEYRKLKGPIIVDPDLHRQYLGSRFEVQPSSTLEQVTVMESSL